MIAITKPSVLHLCYALGALQVADLASTWYALNNGAVEANPLVLALGWPITIGLKAGLVALLVLGARKGGVHRQALQFACVMYLAVIGLNVMAAA